MEDKGFCTKDNMEVDIEKGCRHPKDYCQHRQACIIHFMEQERRRGHKEDDSCRDGDQGKA